MSKHVSIAFLLLAAVIVSACEPNYETEGDRLQHVGEQAVSDIDTSGLGALE